MGPRGRVSVVDDLRTPTTWRQVVVAFLAGLFVAWFLLATARLLDWALPPLSWSVAVVLGLGALAVGGYAFWFRSQVRDPSQQIDHVQAVRTLAIAKATIRVGALAVGGYLLLGLVNVAKLDAPLPRQRATVAAVTVVVGILVAISGWFLERSCQVPPSDDSPGEP